MNDVFEHNECKYKEYCVMHGHHRCERGYDLERYINCNHFRKISYETKDFKKYEKHIRELDLR